MREFITINQTYFKSFIYNKINKRIKVWLKSSNFIFFKFGFQNRLKPKFKVSNFKNSERNGFFSLGFIHSYKKMAYAKRY